MEQRRVYRVIRHEFRLREEFLERDTESRRIEKLRLLLSRKIAKPQAHVAK